MEGSNRRLVVLLTMHRSGSSLTASILQELGMSLGPFDLLGAAPSNPHGHFEAIPFFELNQKLQDWAFGFSHDLPTSPENLARFLERRGAWPTDREVPQEWLEEGERLTRTLIESGSPSGFKDPRTVLTWPFWRLVFQRIENLEVAPAILLRSPHEIGMSLCARTNGNYPYWTALDLVGAHFERLKAIADESAIRPPMVRFATSHYRPDLRKLVAASGLRWDDAVVDRIYDPSCVHQLPAVVAHPAQEVYDELSGGGGEALGGEANTRRVARDRRRYERLMYERLEEMRGLYERSVPALRHAEALFAQAEQASRFWRVEAEGTEQALNDARAELAQTREAYELTSQCLAQAEQNLVQTLECLVSIQERHAWPDEASSAEVWEPGVGSESSLAEMLKRFVMTQDRLDRERTETNEQLQRTHEMLAEIQQSAAETAEQLKLALERGEQLGQEAATLRGRLDRFESHSLFGPALRGRRRVKRMWLKLRERTSGGGERSARIDQAH